jgi:uncharacterized protein (DUF305 family)
MKFFWIILLICSFSVPAMARVEPGYDPGRTPPALTPMYDRVTPLSRQVDLDFVSGMRPHHAGALIMAEKYLTNPDASSTKLKQLARGIIHNQKFEIGMLGMIENFANQPADNTQRIIAMRGLAQEQKFNYAPIPSPFGLTDEIVSAADVAFAKGMIVHHQGALDMANDYLQNANSKNSYLRLMCVDILADQSQEIAFMQDIIAAYPGDADKVKPAKIYGMEHMSHGKHNEKKPCCCKEDCGDMCPTKQPHRH